MQEEATLIREISISEALDYFLPIDGMKSTALARYERHRDALRIEIEAFCSGKTDGALWLCRSAVWHPEALIGSEGIAFKPDNGHPELLWIVDY